MDASDWSVLTRAPLFAAMGANITRTLTQSHSCRDYQRGEMVFRQGDAVESLVVVIEGWVKLYRQREDGEQMVVAVVAAGGVLFEPAMFVGGNYFVSAETVSSARVLLIDGAAMRRVLLEQPSLAFSLLAASSCDTKLLIAHVEQIRMQSVPQRIAEFFLRQVRATAGSATFVLPYNKALIASLLGTIPECFSRSLTQLRDQGVRVERDRVTIQDVGKLAKYAGVQIEEGLDVETALPTPYSSLGRRRAFDEVLAREWRKALDASAPISLLLIDVGHHKPSGDSSAHVDDHRLLSDVREIISLDARDEGRFVAHLGKQIFAVVAPTTDHRGATRLGEKIRVAIETSAIRRAATPSIAAAIGTATIIPTLRDRIEKIVCYADIALYRAKTLGRALVCGFHDEPGCAIAMSSPSGGLRIPEIESSHCAVCRAGAVRG